MVTLGGLPNVQPVKWYLLIQGMERVRKETGMGLARTWGYVHREDYDGALRSYQEVKAMLRERRVSL